MNNDSGLDLTSDTIKEKEVDSSYSGDVGVGTNAEVSLGVGASDETRASPMELDSVPAGSEDGHDSVRVSEKEGSEKLEAGGSDCVKEDGDKEMESRVSEMKTESETDGSNILSTDPNYESVDRQNRVDVPFDGLRAKDESEGRMDLKLDKKAEPEKYPVDYKSLLSEFDDYVASEKMDTGVSRALSFGFQVGDMVWGKVKSHPWWPGHIFNETLASSSVRRTRRVGSVLVAFFGDSSYGWFDPAELIPFDANFAEKSLQTYSRHFVRAVEEAVDETSRRAALGLACKCRNPYNFRTTTVQGYFSVDVPDYEPQVLYSADQIKKARESFEPIVALSFVKQLALVPQSYDVKSIKYLKNKAVASSFRKAVFEEFDETYEQAFGVQPSRLSVNTQDQPFRTPRAPLSGPLVIAEALGDGKSSKKSPRGKEGPKQDKYLLKRRDEADSSKTVQFSPFEASSSVSPFSKTGESSAADYMLQRRTSSFRVDKDAGNSSEKDSGKEFNAKLSIDQGASLMQESEEKPGQTEAIPLGQNEVDPKLGPKYEQPIEGKMSGGGAIKTVKVPKRPLEDTGAENVTSELKKKKKKKKESQPGQEPNSNTPQEMKNVVSVKGGPVAGNVSKKMKSAQLKLLKKDVGSTTVNIRSTELEVPALLGGLRAYGVEPFYGTERRTAAVMRQFFLKFRSLVYQKSLVLSPPRDSESIEGHAIKPTNAENAKVAKPSKSIKAVKKSDDPTRSGKKRLPSDLPEETTARKLKKSKQLMGSEKVGPRTGEVSKKDGKEIPTATSSVKEQSGMGPNLVKPVKATKKLERPPPKVVEPTMLVMKFPPGTSLPSAAQLKARFGRFGLLDQSAIRVFWKSSTCRVVFLYKTDAQTAYRYATGNNSLFGNVNVRYFLRNVEGPAGEGQEFQKGNRDETPDVSRNREPVKEYSSHKQPILQASSNVQLKSCLKKATGDDNGNGNGRRVKFVLGGEESNPNRAPATEPSMASSSGNKFNKSGNLGDASGSSSSSSSVAMDFNSKNISNVFTPTSALPPPLQYSKPQQAVNKHDHLEAAPLRKSHNVQSSAHSAGADISQQMLSLLTRCNDVVANVTGLLGYVPYHPL